MDDKMKQDQQNPNDPNQKKQGQQDQQHGQGQKNPQTDWNQQDKDKNRKQA